MSELLEYELGFELDDFDTLPEMCGEDGVCYYNKEHCFYSCRTDAKEDWWNKETLDIELDCPFCKSSVGGFYDKTKPHVKHWMGKHLALFHAMDVERFILMREQEEEYGSTRMAENPDLYDEEYYGFYC